MFCQKCGKEIPDGSVACNFCGASVIPQEKPAKKETSLTQVAEGALVFGIVGAIIGLFGGLGGMIVGFIVLFILGFIICYAGASMLDIFRIGGKTKKIALIIIAIVVIFLVAISVLPLILIR